MRLGEDVHPALIFITATTGLFKIAITFRLGTIWMIDRPYRIQEQPISQSFPIYIVP